MFCRNCGTKIEEDGICPNCGYSDRVGGNVNNKIKEEDLFITFEETKKIAFSRLVASIILLIIGIYFIFVPMFVYEPTSIEDITWNDLGALLENDGKLNFSYFDEIKLIVTQITSEGSSLNFSDVVKSPLILFIFIIIFIIEIVCIGVKSLIESADDMMDINRLRIKYNQRIINKPKENIVKKIYGGWDVITVLVAVILDGFIGIGGTVVYRHMLERGFLNFANFNFLFVILILLIATFLAVKIHYSTLGDIIKENVSKRIKKKKAQTKAKNKQINEENKRRHLEKLLQKLEQEKKEKQEKEEEYKPHDAGDDLMKVDESKDEEGKPESTTETLKEDK